MYKLVIKVLSVIVYGLLNCFEICIASFCSVAIYLYFAQLHDDMAIPIATILGITVLAYFRQGFKVKESLLRKVNIK